MLTYHLHHLFQKIWNTVEISQDLKDVMIVTIFKKGDRADCGNFRGISLLLVAGKILAKVLLNHYRFPIHSRHDFCCSSSAGKMS